MSNAQTLYPARYYASYDKTAKGTTPVTGWYDMWFYSSVVGAPAADDMLALTEDQWNAHLSNSQQGMGVSGGKLVEFTPAPTPIPLKDHAQYALTQARTFVQNNFIMLGETPSQPWIDYQKALIAIVDGTDAKSTTLPEKPAN